MLSRRRMCRLAVFALLGICTARATSWLLDLREYHRERRMGHELVLQLRDRQPADVNQDTWNWATTWAVNAYGNVCYSPEAVSIDELKQFRADLEEQLRGPVDLATVDWIWNRLGRTGPYGLSYQHRFEPEYREVLDGIARKR